MWLCGGLAFMCFIELLMGFKLLMDDNEAGIFLFLIFGMNLIALIIAYAVTIL